MRRMLPLKSLSWIFVSGISRRMMPIVRAPMQLGPRPMMSLQSLPKINLFWYRLMNLTACASSRMSAFCPELADMSPNMFG